MINIKKKILLTLSSPFLINFWEPLKSHSEENNHKDISFTCYYAVPVEPHDSLCPDTSYSCSLDHSLYEECHALLYRFWFFLDVMQSSQNTVFADTTVYNFLTSLLLKVINITTLFNNDNLHKNECDNIINLINYIMETPIMHNFANLQCMLLLIQNNIKKLKNNNSKHLLKKSNCITVTVI